MSVFQIIGLCIALAFYGAYLSKQILLRRKGIISARLGKGDKSRVRRLEVALAVTTFILPIAQCLSIFANNLVLPLVVPTPLPLQIAGGVVATVGVIYFICAITAMKDSWRAGIDASQDTTLVTRGIYQMSRNPAFTGFDLFYIGMVAIFPNILLLVLSSVAVVLLHVQILQEEKYLAERFGAEYEEYKKKTLRY